MCLGKAGSSFIPVAGWIVGVALIAYDLWEGNQGALPQIQEALQSEEVKSKIREEIATAIKDDLPDQASLIALETSVSLVEQWQGFCTRFGDVCQVADQNPEFRSLLGFVALDELDRLSSLVTWFINQEGRRALDDAVIDGSLERLLALPDTTIASLVATMQPSEAVGWLDVAGDRLDRVIQLGMYRLAQPDEFDKYSVARADGCEQHGRPRKSCWPWPPPSATSCCRCLPIHCRRWLPATRRRSWPSLPTGCWNLPSRLRLPSRSPRTWRRATSRSTNWRTVPADAGEHGGSDRQRSEHGG